MSEKKYSWVRCKDGLYVMHQWGTELPEDADDSAKTYKETDYWYIKGTWPIHGVVGRTKVTKYIEYACPSRQLIFPSDSRVYR